MALLRHLSPDQDPREVFADWLIDPKEPVVHAEHCESRLGVAAGARHHPGAGRRPARQSALESRVAGFAAAGIGHQPLRPEAPLPADPDLEDLPAFLHPEGRRAAEDANFSHISCAGWTRRCSIDAIDKITGGTEKYSSAIPEPFTFIPENKRSIALPDGSITSSFLEMFGRSSRDTGLESERNNRPTAEQRLHLLNSSHIQRKIEQSPMIQEPDRRPGKVRAKSPRGIYLGILSRFPTEEELKTVEAYFQAGKVELSREAAVDVVWSLINSAEFLYRH